MNKQEVLKVQTCVLKVSIHCDGCKQKVKKHLQKIDGVYSIKIDAEQGKVTVSGTVDPQTLVKKLGKSGKHVEICGPQKGSNENYQNQLNNQIKNMQMGNIKGDKGNNFQNLLNNQLKNIQMEIKGGKNSKSQKGGSDQPKQMPQMNGSKNQKASQKDQKTVRFNLPGDDFEQSDDDMDDDFDDLDDDELDDAEFCGDHHPPSKNISSKVKSTNDKKIDSKKGVTDGGGGNEKKAKNKGGGGGNDNKGGNDKKGGLYGILKSFTSKSEDKKGEKKGKDSQAAKNGGKKGEDDSKKNGNKGKSGGTNHGNGGNPGNDGKKGGNKNDGNQGMKNGFHDFNMANPGINGGNMNMMNMGHPQMCMNPPNGYYPGGMGAAPGGAVINPYNQQYNMAMMMNQQRPPIDNGMFHPMMYARPPAPMGYYPQMQMQAPPMADPYAHMFSDENANGCSVM